MGLGFQIVVAVNSNCVLEQNLLRSPMVQRGAVEVLEERGHASAGAAYNAGLARAAAEHVVFAHQDVYFPGGWEALLRKAICDLDARQCPWGVLGICGMRADGRFAGRVWCSGADREHVGIFSGIEPVVSIDEIVIVLNNRHGLSFDEDLPGFHLYATDIILQARVRGLNAYVIDAPVVHNSRCNPQPLDAAYRAAYRYMQKKWSAQLPLRTCVVDVTRWGWPLYRQWAKEEIRRLRGRVKARPPQPDPRAIAVRLGYERTDHLINERGLR